MADGDTYIDIGGKMSIASGKPATLDATGFAALSYTQIKGVLNIPENGDTAEDVSEPTLEDGRTEHFYGTKDGGGIDVPLKYIEGDAGQALILPGVDRDVNAVWSFKIEDSDGTITYKYGRIGPVRRRERSSNAFKGFIMPIMFNSAEVVA
ncbi:hypothetical protein [Rhodovulum sp. FJ3]|uniref:hypothetical protein n=1 Tax=Rhodovulum sp. FJ3 TaxID=3079053 RepID=UPI00293DC58A|nr:hypothetical protein [Rhodovulum sp. FJ3]MDV4167817.1 hypothetical protein [Rhodovulum sp. FJ3]